MKEFLAAGGEKTSRKAGSALESCCFAGLVVLVWFWFGFGGLGLVLVVVFLFLRKLFVNDCSIAI